MQHSKKISKIETEKNSKNTFDMKGGTFIEVLNGKKQLSLLLSLLLVCSFLSY